MAYQTSDIPFTQDIDQYTILTAKCDDDGNVHGCIQALHTQVAPERKHFVTLSLISVHVREAIVTVQATLKGE